MGGGFVTLADRIKQIREKKGLRQKDVASSMGISQQAYSQYESGTREPKKETINRIARALGVSQFELLRPVMENDEDYVNTEWFGEMTDADIFASMVPPEEMSRLVGLNSITSGLDKENYEKLIEYAAFLRARQDASNNSDKK